LTAGSMGRLGDSAPSWIPDASAIGVIGYFAWVLLVSGLTRRSSGPGRWTFWLGILGSASVLVQALVSILLFYLYPGFVSTNATISFEFAFALLTWLCLPAWLIVLAVQIRRAQPDGDKPAHTQKAVTASSRPPS